MNLDASGEFERIAREKVLEQECDRANNELDIFRYEFACKIAQGENPDLNDVFGYLQKWAEYNIAFRNYAKEPIREFHI